MVVRIRQWTLDVRDVALDGAVLGGGAGLPDRRRRPAPVAAARCRPHAPSVWLQPVDEPTPGKNRGHPDLSPDGDGEAEVERLLALGARRVEIGQTGDEGFVVLADPEGNEFCVFREPRGA